MKSKASSSKKTKRPNPELGIVVARVQFSSRDTAGFAVNRDQGEFQLVLLAVAMNNDPTETKL